MENIEKSKYGQQDMFLRGLDSLLYPFCSGMDTRWGIKSIKEFNREEADSFFVELLIIDLHDKRRTEKVTTYPPFYKEEEKSNTFTPHFKNGWTAIEVINVLKTRFTYVQNN